MRHNGIELNAYRSLRRSPRWKASAETAGHSYARAAVAAEAALLVRDERVLGAALAVMDLCACVAIAGAIRRIPGAWSVFRKEDIEAAFDDSIEEWDV